MGSSEQKHNLFHPSQEDRIESPEKLNEYVRVATPRAWLLLVALGAILVAFFVWGFTGSIPVIQTITGIAMTEGAEEDIIGPETKVYNILCLVDGEEVMGRDLQYKEASVIFRDGTRASGNSAIVDTNPLSDKEVEELLQEYNIDYQIVLSSLGDGEYRYLVNVYLYEPLDYLYWGEVCEVNLTVETVKPITYVLGR